MIPKGCKRLAEVDFPIAEVSRHAVAENKIRHGHPKTIHLWWARRPLASSRAVLLALLWPDPCDALCPAAFKAEARNRLREVGGCNPGTTDADLRKALLRFIADFANWDLASNPTYLDVSRALVKVAHSPPGAAKGTSRRWWWTHSPAGARSRWRHCVWGARRSQAISTRSPA